MKAKEIVNETQYEDEIYATIVEMGVDIKYIREQLSEGKSTFKEHSNRIQMLEQQQQLLTGKMTIIVIGIGAVILGAAHILVWVLDKAIGK